MLFPRHELHLRESGEKLDSCGETLSRLGTASLEVLFSGKCQFEDTITLFHLHVTYLGSFRVYFSNIVTRYSAKASSHVFTFCTRKYLNVNNLSFVSLAAFGNVTRDPLILSLFNIR